MASCINHDLDNVNKDLTNAEIMKQLKISDVAIWNTLTTQSIDLSTLKSSGLKSGQDMNVYPSGSKYYFALFEDLYPSEGDYDFNDIIIKSRVGLEVKGNVITGYVDSKIVNKGGSLPVEIGLMFYKVTGKKYTRIPNKDITIDGEPLVEGEGPWTKPYEEFGTERKVNFTCKYQGAGIGNIWINYFIVTVKDGKRTEILTSGFAPTNVATEFETPNLNFISSKNKLPWGLEIEAEKFAIPNEKVLFLKAYPEFKEWVESNGVKNQKWFDKPDPLYTHK
jgi:hypothetical protein